MQVEQTLTMDQSWMNLWNGVLGEEEWNLNLRMSRNDFMDVVEKVRPFLSMKEQNFGSMHWLLRRKLLLHYSIWETKGTIVNMSLMNSEGCMCHDNFGGGSWILETSQRCWLNEKPSSSIWRLFCIFPKFWLLRWHSHTNKTAQSKQSRLFLLQDKVQFECASTLWL